MATIDVVTATHKRAVAATRRTTTRNPSATVVAFDNCGHRHNRTVTRAMPRQPKARVRKSAERVIRAS